MYKSLTMLPFIVSSCLRSNSCVRWHRSRQKSILKPHTKDNVSSAEYTHNIMSTKQRHAEWKRIFCCLFTPTLTYSGNVSLHLKYILSFYVDISETEGQPSELRKRITSPELILAWKREVVCPYTTHYLTLM